MRIDARRLVGPTLLLGATITACGPQSGTLTSASPSALASPSPSSFEAAATPSLTAEDPAPLPEGALQPGWYRTSNFQPTVAFKVGGDGWKTFFVDDADEAYMEGDAGVMVQMTRLSKVVDPATGAATDAPDDLIAWFLAHPRLNASDNLDDRTALAGLPVRSATYATTGSDVPLFAYDLGNFHLRPGMWSRSYVMQMDGPDLVVTVLAKSDGSIPDAEAAVLDSLQIFEGE